jgi:hypothetical protein
MIYAEVSVLRTTVLFVPYTQCAAFVNQLLQP